jgi:hypothetical protein
VPEPLPPHWLQPRADGNALMFVDTQFPDESVGELANGHRA